jgi:superfamily I DNA/RNA helicase
MDAERRLFYVAITRAERVLMYIAEPDEWGNPRSRFLAKDGVGLV